MAYQAATDIASGLTQARLCEVLVYQPDTGLFRWRITKANVRAGTVAGCVAASGYRKINVDGRLFRAHRLAWLYVHGRWPADQIDHVNGDRDNNRIANLREANWTQNFANKKPDARNKSGAKGVSWDKSRRRWAAHIKIGGRSQFLGRYDRKEDAAQAYWAAAKKLFGEFARAA